MSAFAHDEDPELRRIVRDLVRVVGQYDGEKPSWLFNSGDVDEAGGPDILANLAEAIMRLHMDRRTFMGEDLFGEPGWEILLDLFTQKRRSKRVLISMIGNISGVKPSTALRWIGILHQRGLLQRELDTSDQRRVWVSLTADGEKKISQFLIHSFRTFNNFDSGRLGSVKPK